MQKYLIKLAILPCLLLFSIIFIGFFCAKSINIPKTELAVLDTLSDSVEVTGIVLRRETEILNNTPGILNFVLNDGEKVSKNGVVAEVYKNEEEILAQKAIKNLTKKMNLLESSKKTNENLVNNALNVEKKNYEFLKNFNSFLVNNNYVEAEQNKENNLLLLDNNSNWTAKKTQIDEEIIKLKQKRDKLLSNASHKYSTINASESGYFVGNIDGFENVVDVKNVCSLKPANVAEMLHKKLTKSGAVAKIINDSSWFFVCNINKNQALKFNVGDFVTLDLPSSNLTKISAQIVALNQDNKNSDATLVLKCRDINQNILKLRLETAKINIKTYSGIKVRRSALHENTVTKTEIDENDNKNTFNKNVIGVFVQRGRQILFKEVELLFVENDYAICKNFVNENSANSTNYLKIYDEVVVEGQNLYDKKVIK